MGKNLLEQAMKVLLASTVYSAKKSKEAWVALHTNVARNNSKDKTLFDSITLCSLIIPNRIVMAPMTRNRAINNVPNSMMTDYYSQRSSAGLIITESTSPSPNGLGFARIPGIFSEQQVEAWRNITLAVHQGDAKIFVQLMHTGRASHSLNMPENATIMAPSALKAVGQIWTDAELLQEYPIPEEMTYDDIQLTKYEFNAAAKNAMDAGFDGVEIHAANGFLLEQFLSAQSNVRTDMYGGNIQNRCRLILEIVKDVADTIGKDKTSIRLSPFGMASETIGYPKIDETFKYLCDKLNVIDIAFMHLVEHSEMGNTAIPLTLKREIRNRFKNKLILSGGYNRDSAIEDIQNGLGDMVAFGRPFINNPDFADRLKNNWPLATDLKTDHYYTASDFGYSDYPNYKKEIEEARNR